MSRTLLNPWLIIFGLLFTGHQLAQKVFGIALPVIDSYLDPLLLAPLLLTGMLLERRWLLGKGPDYCLSPQELMLSALALALVSEWLFPAISPRFTADPVDALAIFGGTLLFHLVLNRSGAGDHKSSCNPSRPC